MIPTCWIPPEAFPLLQKIMLRRCGIELGDEYALNGASMDQRRKWHMNRMTLTGRVVVTLINLFGHCIKAARCALGMDAECWGLNIAGSRFRSTKPGEKRFCENLLWISKMSHLQAYFAQCKDDRSQVKEAWTKTMESDWFSLDMQEFHIWVRATSSAHSWSRAPKFSHLCGVGPRLLKMLPLTSLDSNDFFWLVQVLHRLTYRNLSKRFLTAWHTRGTHFPPKAFSTSPLFQALWEGKAQTFSEERQGQSRVLSTHLEGSFHGRFRFRGCFRNRNSAGTVGPNVLSFNSCKQRTTRKLSDFMATWP